MSLVKRSAILLICIKLGVFPLLTLGAPKADLWSYWDQQNPNNSEVVDHSLWQLFLASYLVTDDDSGIHLVKYADVTERDKASLERYVTTLLTIDPRALNKAEQFAYWVNLYNAATVRLIVREYPVASITKLGEGFFAFGPWNDKIGEVAGQAITLNDIEHRILRPIWREPRIHFAVNCASMGCPNLMPQAYTAANTEALLSRGARDFITHPRGTHIQDDRITLSSIFNWYSQDFGASETQVLHYLAQYLTESKALALLNSSSKIVYDYDWSLNETK